MASAVASIGFLFTASIFGHTLAARQLPIRNVMTTSTDVNAVASAAAMNSKTDAIFSCGLEVPGWGKQSSTFPMGTWEPYFTSTIAECTKACSENSYRCAAVLWRDEKFFPSSDDAKCQFVSDIRGYKTSSRQGIDLYTPCTTGCGSKVGGYEVHYGTLPLGQWRPYFTDSVEGCAEACSRNLENCVAGIWENSQAYYQSDYARCQLVSVLSGYTFGMPRGVDTYVRRNAP